MGRVTSDKRHRLSRSSRRRRSGGSLRSGNTPKKSKSMAYALTTTKRKFHRILDSISNTSNTSLPLPRSQENASTTTLTEPIAKKARSIRPQSAFIPSTPTKSIESGGRSRATSLGEDGTPTKPKKPTYTPWDRDDFLVRLKTFQQMYQWMWRPDKLNELEMAKRGWKLIGMDRCACVTCGKEVLMKLEPEVHSYIEGMPGQAPREEVEWKQAAREALVEKYAEMIITGHDEGCLWRGRGCDATIQRIPLAHSTTALEALKIRYESFFNLKCPLPTTTRTPSTLDIKSIAQTLSSSLHPTTASNITQSTTTDTPSESPSAAPEVNILALQFALLGWYASSDTLNINSYATCHACWSRIGLWLFTPRLDPRSPSEIQEPVMSYLDLAEQHKRYCPWIDGHAQSGGMPWNGGGVDKGRELCGWELLGKHVENMRIEKERGIEGSGGKAITLGKEEREVKDKERWAKLKRLKQAFRVKSVKKVGVGKENVALVSRPSTSGTVRSGVGNTAHGEIGATNGTATNITAGGTTN